MIIYLDIMSP